MLTPPLSLLLHTYPPPPDSNNNEISAKLLKIMLEAMLPPQNTLLTSSETTPLSSPAESAELSVPLSLHTLNSLAMHAKIRLMEMIKTHLIKVVEAKMPEGQITPALLETYSRLLVWLGTRNFQCKATR